MTEENYIALIIRKLSKEISIEENSILEKWVSLNEKNKELYNSTLLNWENTKLYKSSYKANKELAWQKLQKRMSQNSISKPKVVAFNFKRIFKIAATVIILISLSYFIKDSFLNSNITEIQTANSETKNIILPDGSKVFLNENSTLQYATNFEKRDVKLEGEAFFEVTKKPKRPFIITAGETQTQVLGTSFNVEVNKENVEVILLTGKVKFSNMTNNSLILNPGEIGLYNKETAVFSKRDTKIENKHYWQTKKLDFENIKVSDVILSLENYYDVEIQFNENSNCTFTGKFDDTKIEEVLDVLSYSLNTNYIKNNETYIINEFDCK